MGNTKTKPLSIPDQGTSSPRTPIKVYNNALKVLDMAAQFSDAKKTSDANKAFQLAVSDFKEALIFAVSDAAPALAYIYINGYGVEKDYEIAKLFIVMGDKLGDNICTNFMNGTNHDIYNIANFLNVNPNSKVYSKEIFSKAEKYVKAAKDIQLQYGEDPLLTNKILGNAITHFEKSDLSHTIKIFLDKEQPKEPQHVLDNKVKKMLDNIKSQFSNKATGQNHNNIKLSNKPNANSRNI